MDVTADPYKSSDIVTTVFSSYGPTDDGRVKPDVVGNGHDVFSTMSGANNAYASMSGTSMAAPNVTGTMTLVAQHYRNVFGSLPNAATQKLLAIHTAADAGTPGPNYAYGWGLLDGAAAATFISEVASGTEPVLLRQGVYTGTELTYQLVSDGTRPVEGHAGLDGSTRYAVHPDGLDVRTPVLVHDLDLTDHRTRGAPIIPGHWIRRTRRLRRSGRCRIGWTMSSRC
jgi:subtilisin family serine protease